MRNPFARVDAAGRPAIRWRLFQLLTVIGLVSSTWYSLQHSPYRIDIDVYRMASQAWMANTPLYSGTPFHTQDGLDLPFTYPPLAAIMFAPFAWLPLPAASATITVATLVALIIATAIVLSRLQVWQRSEVAPGPAWRRRCWLATAIVAVAAVALEPIRANIEFGQINAVLMTLVIADCVPRKTPWPRGLLLGVAIAIKLTPAVFLLYFLLRRDGRTLLTASASAVAVTLAAFLLASNDSWVYWTDTVYRTGRIGGATLYTNQNFVGLMARLGLGEQTRFVLWTVVSFALLAVTVWAVRRILRSAVDPVLAVICVAMFGLAVSPVSWSHHWVWALPTVLVTAVVARRHGSRALAVVSIIGLTIMVLPPMMLLPMHHETSAALWRQIAGGAYLWWALAVIVVSGAMATKVRAPSRSSVEAAPVPALN